MKVRPPFKLTARGCTGSCVTGGANTRTALATIARQTGGPRLFAANDTP